MGQTGPADGSLSLGKVGARTVHPAGLAGMARFWVLFAAAGGSQAAEAVTTDAPAVAGGVRFRQSGGPISTRGGHEPVPAIYGPSGDVKWDEADPTYSPEAARRGG